MRISASTKFATRGLVRNVRRTILSVVGISFAVAICLIITAFWTGAWDVWTGAMVNSGLGHARIVPADWLERRENELRLKDWRAELAVARSTEGVVVATPRARTNALLGFGTRTVGTELVGVDPVTEPEACKFVSEVSKGRYLRPDDAGAMVVGEVVAERLDVDLDDEIMVTAVGEKGEMRNSMLVIVGLVDAGHREVSAGISQVTLQDFERLAGIEGAGEITIVVEDVDRVDGPAAAIGAGLPDGDIVIGLADILPGLFQVAGAKGAYTVLIVAIAVFVVVLGIVSAQLTAVLERRREFAVLTALGMKAVQVARLVLVEAVVLGVAGGVLGLLLAMPAVYYIATEGFSMSMIFEDGYPPIAGVLLEPVMDGKMGLWLVPMAFGVALAATLLASIYPIWLVRNIDPASALRVAQ